MKKRTKIIIIVTLAIILISGITVAASKIWWGDNSGTVKADTIESSPEENDKMLAETSENGEIKDENNERDRSAKDEVKDADEAPAKSAGIKSAVDSNVEIAKENVNKKENDKILKTGTDNKVTPAEKKTLDSGNGQSGETPVQPKTETPAEKRTEAPVQQKTETPTEKRTEAPVQQKAESPVENKTETPVQQRTEASTEKRTEAPAQPKAEIPTETPECNHNWVWKTHTETIHHDAVTHTEYYYSDAWDEAVYVTKVRCFVCNTYYASDADYHASDTCMGSYGHEDVIDHYIHHEPQVIDSEEIVDQAAYDEILEIKDYQYCSKCGERK